MSPRRLLLDTHVWLWWQANDGRLGAKARRLIQRASEVRFSAASAWEIAIKTSIGKLALPTNADIAGELAHSGFLPLPVELAHAEVVRALPYIHRDPFDRLLVAQARYEALTLVSADRALAAYGISVEDATV
ncbi:MAG: type II toxin-antitoxin system VapC family toxin [Gemmatimonadota bacterium]